MLVYVLLKFIWQQWIIFTGVVSKNNGKQMNQKELNFVPNLKQFIVPLPVGQSGQKFEQNSYKHLKS